MTNRNIYELLSQGERVTLECKKNLRKGLPVTGYGENLGSGFPLILNA